MAKLIMMRGLPASGKSTKAQEIVEQGGWVRLNRDLLRKMLHYDKWSGRNEGITVDAEKDLARALLKADTNVVVDDCNLGQEHRDMWSAIAKESEAKFEVVEMATPVSTCRFRDQERENRVGADVITNMALRYGLHPKPEKGYIFCDLDGTLCDISHRLPLVKGLAEGEKKDWKRFFERIPYDKPRMDVMKMLQDYQREGYDIVFISGRPDTYKKHTLVWLITHTERYLPKGFLTIIMRRGHDKRPDNEVKQDILNMYFPDRSQVHMVIDDRPSVIRMWKENGLPVTDVGQGIEF